MSVGTWEQEGRRRWKEGKMNIVWKYQSQTQPVVERDVLAELLQLD